MLVDCDRCSARALRCDNCVVGLLLGPPDGRLQLATVGPPATATSLGASPPRGSEIRRGAAIEAADSGNSDGVVAGAEEATVADGPVVHVDPRSARPGDFDTAERRALAALAGAGLIQPLGLAVDGEGVTNGVYTLTERHSLAG